MNRVSKFFHEILHPHCDHCREEIADDKICVSCETLKEQLAIANIEKDALLSRILEKPAPAPVTEAPQLTMPKMLPWRVRQQMLEAEDRAKAKVLRSAPVSTEELEKDLGVAQEVREAQAK